MIASADRGRLPHCLLGRNGDHGTQSAAISEVLTSRVLVSVISLRDGRQPDQLASEEIRRLVRSHERGGLRQTRAQEHAATNELHDLKECLLSRSDDHGKHLLPRIPHSALSLLMLLALSGCALSHRECTVRNPATW